MVTVTGRGPHPTYTPQIQLDFLCKELPPIAKEKPESGIRFTLPETNIFPENGWLEYNPFLLGRSIFRGKLAVSFREGTRFDSPWAFSL